MRLPDLPWVLGEEVHGAAGCWQPGAHAGVQEQAGMPELVSGEELAGGGRKGQGVGRTA